MGRIVGRDSGTVARGVDGIPDEVGEHLEHIASVDFGRDLSLEPFVEVDSFGRDLFLVHRDAAWASVAIAIDSRVSGD